MASAYRFPAIFLIALLCGSCTALKVVTHSTSSDPIDMPAGHYQLDPHHWSLVFDVDHFGYSRFVMRFDHVRADLDFLPDDPERCQVTASVDASSIDTNVAELDALVKGPDLLDTEHFPEIRFVSRQLRRTGKNVGEMDGDLTIHGETWPITLTVTFNGGAANPLTGKNTLGFAAVGHVNRASYGVGRWFPAVGADLRVTVQAEFVESGF